MRLWPVNRLVTTALMSLPPGTRLLGSHLVSFQTSVNAVVYSRVGEYGACAVPPGVSGLPHASWVLALLPIVVNVGSPSAWSHGPNEAMFSWLSPAAQPGVPAYQHSTTELVGSTVVLVTLARSGLARNARHVGWGRPVALPPVSLVSTVAVNGPPICALSNAHTWKV